MFSAVDSVLLDASPFSWSVVRWLPITNRVLLPIKGQKELIVLNIKISYRKLTILYQLRLSPEIQLSCGGRKLVRGLINRTALALFLLPSNDSVMLVMNSFLTSVPWRTIRLQLWPGLQLRSWNQVWRYVRRMRVCRWKDRQAVWPM